MISKFDFIELFHSISYMKQKGVAIMVFDFSKLDGKITEKYGNRKKFCTAINMKQAALSSRMNNKVPFRPEEIILICSPIVLDIPHTNIGEYFFRLKV